jgi:hypothetical protein
MSLPQEQSEETQLNHDNRTRFSDVIGNRLSASILFIYSLPHLLDRGATVHTLQREMRALMGLFTMDTLFALKRRQAGLPPRGGNFLRYSRGAI